MKLIPLYDETAPVACTLDATDLDARLEQMDRMRGSLIGTARTEHGLLLRFAPSPEIEAELAQLRRRRKGLLSVLGFRVVRRPTDHEIALRWDGPPSVNELLDGLLVFFDGNSSIEEVRGLL